MEDCDLDIGGSSNVIEAHELGPEHLVLSHFSLGSHPFDTRCAAAGAAGFDAIGLLHRDFRALVTDTGRTTDELAATAASHGLRIVEIEAVSGWSAATPPGPATALLEVCLTMAAAFGARHITAVAAYDGTVDDAVEGFATLCDRAAELGARVGLEPIPVQSASDIAAARAIVEQAGRPNGGLCIDSWHLERGGGHWDQLEDLPGDLVTSIQINDGTRTPEHDHYIEDCLWNRRLCGRGEFDLERYITTLDRIGASAPYSVEIISSQLAAQDPYAVAEAMARTTRATIAAARQ